VNLDMFFLKSYQDCCLKEKLILGMNLLRTYGAKIDYEDLKVILRDESGREACFYAQREEKPCPIISVMKASRLICQGCIVYW